MSPSHYNQLVTYCWAAMNMMTEYIVCIEKTTKFTQYYNNMQHII